MAAMRRPGRFGVWAGHAARLAVVAAIAWLVHAEHGASLDRRQAVSLDAVPIDLIRTYLPEAARVGGESAVVAGGRELVDEAGQGVGTVLRTSPAGDAAIGFSGPTDAAVCFDPTGTVAGVIVATSYDNEPYVGYVRDDRAFRRLWSGLTIKQVAGIDPDDTGVEGVSGATMTSQAVAAGLVRAARDHRRAAGTAAPDAWLRRIEPPQWGALAVIAIGVTTAFTRLKGTWFGRYALPVAVLAYLGFGAGALVSQAQLWGWAEAGVPRGAVVLAALAAAALLLPVTTRRNVYCSHLCAHGAAQQLLLRIARPRRALPGWLRPLAAVLPWILLAVAIVATVLHWPLALVDLEPFDAYLPAVAGGACLLYTSDAADE